MDHDYGRACQSFFSNKDHAGNVLIAAEKFTKNRLNRMIN